MFDKPIHIILFSFITGVQGRIQVPERNMHVLSEWHTFEMRDSIFVKGKDNMTPCLLSFDKNGASHLEGVPFAQDVHELFRYLDTTLHT